MKYLAALLLSGCAVSPNTWVQDAPDFKLTRVEWNYISGPDAHQRMVNLCGDAPHLMGCAIRIRESGLCVVFSTYSEVQAMWVKTKDGMTLHQHESKHCNGWGHK